MDLAIDVIIVPQGAECRAVRQGLKKLKVKPRIIAIPIGTNRIEETLSKQDFWQSNPKRVLMMGLCGSLSSSFSVGDLALYHGCYQQREHKSNGNYLEINSELNSLIRSKINTQLRQAGSIFVTGVTSQQVITKVATKRQLAEDFSAQVIDMENYQYIACLQQKNIELSILRIVSDDLKFDLPKLEKAISIDGKLKPLTLITEMSRTPYCSIKFVISSLLALKKLRKVVTMIFSN